MSPRTTSRSQILSAEGAQLDHFKSDFRFRSRDSVERVARACRLKSRNWLARPWSLFISLGLVRDFLDRLGVRDIL